MLGMMSAKASDIIKPDRYWIFEPDSTKKSDNDILLCIYIYILYMCNFLTHNINNDFDTDPTDLF